MTLSAVPSWACTALDSPAALKDSHLLKTKSKALSQPPRFTSNPRALLFLLGTGLFFYGLSWEAQADWEKFTFKQDRKAKGLPDTFMDSGTRARCRYPQYFGENCVWTGLYLASLPTLLSCAPVGGLLAGLGLCSPLAVFWFTVCASGIPIQEKSYEQRFGQMEAYREYKKSTPLLCPFERTPKRQ